MSLMSAPMTYDVPRLFRLRRDKSRALDGLMRPGGKVLKITFCQPGYLPDIHVAIDEKHHTLRPIEPVREGLHIGRPKLPETFCLAQDVTSERMT